jgi:UDP-N-acetylglucosamine acyltransferase
VKSELSQEPEIIEILDFFASGTHGRKFIKPFKN